MTENFNAFNNDAYCTKLISMTDSEDLFEWIKEQNDIEKTLGELSTQVESESLAYEFVSMGVTEIWVVEIERASEDYKRENSGKLCIKLPNNKFQRNETIEKINEMLNEQGFDEIPDAGQEYAYLPLD